MSVFPFEYEDLDEETNEAIKKDFKGYTNGLINVKPYNLCIGPEYKKYAEKIYNMEVRSDDVWIVTYPKAGTTWAQAAIWSILNDGNFDLLEGQHVMAKWMFLEVAVLFKEGLDRLVAEKSIPEEYIPHAKSFTNDLERAVNAPRDVPRLIKTHLPFPFLPPKLLDTAKVVYVARNPRDVCVSFYHHHKLFRICDFQGDFQKFFDYFINDLVLESPYWPHLIDAWNNRHHSNMLFLFYEDMKKDFNCALTKLATFLGKQVSKEMQEKLSTELSFEGIRRNPAMSYDMAKEFGLMTKEGDFFRKGIVGDWKNYFTPEMTKRMNEWSEKGRQGCDIQFPGEDL